MSDVLLELDEFREMFGEVDTPSADKQLQRPLGVALRRIKRWVGEEVYNNAVAADESDDCRNDLQCAAGYLAMHFLIANFNTVVRPGGIVKTEKTEGMTVLTYLSPNETAARSQEFFDLAEEMILPWISDAVVSATVETVLDEC